MSTTLYDPENPEARACQSHPLGIHTICPSPTNPRKTFPEAEQAEMTDSVQRHGVLQPLLVRLWPAEYEKPAGWTDAPLYELIAGERRHRAAQAAGLQLVPGIVRHLTTREVLEIQVIENLHRADLHPLDDVEVWGNGASFDNVILRSAFQRAGMDTPWAWWNDRCYRTIKSQNRDVPMQRLGTHHNALDDAVSQAQHLITILSPGKRAAAIEMQKGAESAF